MNFASKNLCYLLWKDSVTKEKWATTIASWAKCSKKRAMELLTDESASMRESEIRSVCNIHELLSDDFLYSDYLEQDSKIDVIQENLKWVLSSLAHGEKKEIAAKLNRGQITISRWQKGDQVPEAPTLKRLKDIFGIPEDTDLSSKPLFLDPAPILNAEKKRWIQARINELPAHELNELFPALQKLLGSNSKE